MSFTQNTLHDHAMRIFVYFLHSIYHVLSVYSLSLTLSEVSGSRDSLSHSLFIPGTQHMVGVQSVFEGGSGQ